jgi:galactokinase
MAVENDMVMAVSTSDTLRTIEIANTDSQHFPSAKFDIPDDDVVPIDAAKNDWVNYFKCGLVIGNQYLRKIGHKPKLVGMKILIDGNVPTGSGLSSSAAFVVCSTLAVLKGNGHTDVSKELLQELSITCEQLVGVNSGGMDQAASIFGERNHALFVSFRPEFSVEPVSFPDTNPRMAFVIANSLVVVNKQESAPIHYNLRVVEVTIAANILARKLFINDLEQDGNLQGGTLRGVLEKHFKTRLGYRGDSEEPSNDIAREQLEQMGKVADFIFEKRDGYTTEEAAELLGVSVDEIRKKYMSTFPVRYDKLQLWKRTRHVYEEAKRVLDFLQLLDDHKTPVDEKLTALGLLMNKSHESARDLFENSCQELDDICEIALANGSLGSRVTGAGWGGSSVHLVPADRAENLIKALADGYYRKKFPHITDGEIAEALLVSEPACGTRVVENISLD